MGWGGIGKAARTGVAGAVAAERVNVSAGVPEGE